MNQLYGPQTWLAWAAPDGVAWYCSLEEFQPERARLLDALAVSCMGEVPCEVCRMTAESVDDRDSPYWDVVPCTKLVNVATAHTWRLSPERLQLWQVLAEHYFHARKTDKD